MRLLVSILIALSLGACSFKKDDGKLPESSNQTTSNENTDVIKTISEEQDRQAAEGVLTKENVSVNFTEVDEPGIYKMTVSWPQGIRKISIIHNDQTEIIFIKENKYEVSVQQNTVQNIILKSYDQFSSPISVLKLNEKSPEDFILNKMVVLDKDTWINAKRIYFLEDGRIVTNGYNLSITGEKIFVKDYTSIGRAFWETSHIITFIPTFVATEAKQLLGSNISIHAKKAKGELRVSLIGATGQNGASGEEIAARSNVSLLQRDPYFNGKDGQPGKLENKTRTCPPQRVEQCEAVVTVCTKAPTDGEDGKRGARGIDGGNGWNGGATGSLSVMIETPDQFNMRIGKRKGPPGQGGVGSVGFLGGLGGKAGTSPGKPCPAAKAGNEGPRGPRGQDGKPGSYGAEGSVNLGSNFNMEIRDL